MAAFSGAGTADTWGNHPNFEDDLTLSVPSPLSSRLVLCQAVLEGE